MVWRVIETDENVWLVQPAAERRANQKAWRLMLSFRQKVSDNPHVFWASFPIECSSKTALFNRAEGISDEDLRGMIANRES